MNSTTLARQIDDGSLIGLAPLMRMAFSDADLKPLGAQLIERAGRHPDDANAMLDLSTVLQLTGNRELALATQAEALQRQQLYHVPTAAGAPAVRLLAVMAAGDLMANTPLEFLLEQSDVSLDLFYVGPGLPVPPALPEHDVAFVAIGESDENQVLLQEIAGPLQSWPRPVLNAPERIASLSRDAASRLLHSMPGIDMPLSARMDRETLERVGRAELPIAALIEDGSFPIIVRPIGSHAGHGLQKIDAAADILNYLQSMPDNAFYVARFVDYRGPDGLFRKYRIVLIDGHPYACHMGISTHWMIHYLNAGMLDSAEKRAEEARFMANFEHDFARRHAAALHAISDRMGLDYVGIDCGETTDGKLLLFEVDSDMIIHAMDPVDVFPYKQPQMRKVFAAFRALLDAAMSRDPGTNGRAS